MIRDVDFPHHRRFLRRSRKIAAAENETFEFVSVSQTQAAIYEEIEKKLFHFSGGKLRDDARQRGDRPPPRRRPPAYAHFYGRRAARFLVAAGSRADVRDCRVADVCNRGDVRLSRMDWRPI